MEKTKLYLIPTSNIQTIVKDKIVYFKYIDEPQEPIEDLKNLVIIKNEREIKILFTFSQETKLLINKCQLEKYVISKIELLNIIDDEYIDALSVYIDEQIIKEKTKLKKYPL